MALRARKGVNGATVVDVDSSSVPEPIPPPSASSPKTSPTMSSPSASSSPLASSSSSPRRVFRRKGRSGRDSESISATTVLGVVAATFLLAYCVEHYRSSRRLQALSYGAIEEDPAETAPVAHLKKELATWGLSLEEDEALEFHPDDHRRSHLLFSTDCSPYQHWQSYLVYFSAMKVKQPGHVTRIASGCNETEAVAIQDWFQEHIQHMSKRFHLHLTPQFSTVKNEGGEIVGDYKFFNKPFGLRHWLENSPQLECDDATLDQLQNEFVILIDPDMALLRPIGSDFSSERDTVIGPYRLKANGGKPYASQVQPGIPIGQNYGLGTQWLTFDLDKIAGPDSPAKDVNKEDGLLYYTAGPPYIATVGDMYRISLKWTEFVPLVHAQYPFLLAEMFAYCLAAAHLGLKHQLVNSLMVSNYEVFGEGWPLIDRIPADEVCDFARHVKPSDRYAVPNVIHMCQRYTLGEEQWYFGKHVVPHDILECPSPLLLEPPSNVATLYKTRKPPYEKESALVKPQVAIREAFMLCYLHSLINEAAIFYKANACTKESANLEKSLRLIDEFYVLQRQHDQDSTMKQ